MEMGQKGGDTEEKTESVTAPGDSETVRRLELRALKASWFCLIVRRSHAHLD